MQILGRRRAAQQRGNLRIIEKAPNQLLKEGLGEAADERIQLRPQFVDGEAGVWLEIGQRILLRSGLAELLDRKLRSSVVAGDFNLHFNDIAGLKRVRTGLEVVP